MKAAARRVLNACTRAITPSDLSSRSQAICEHVGSLAVFKRANSVALYLAMPGGEVQTQALLDAALGEGKTVWVPKVCNAEGVPLPCLQRRTPPQVDFLTGRMDMYPVASHAAVAALPQNKWGIPEPGQSTVSALRGNGDPLDLVIVPGLGFDCSGGRIGRGKGYYGELLSL